MFKGTDMINYLLNQGHSKNIDIASFSSMTGYIQMGLAAHLIERIYE